MTHPLITIMVPTYNQSGYIAQAVQSALAQDWPNLEVLVADDASTDATGRVLAALPRDNRLRIVRRPHNLGRVGNYQDTLKDARGDWVLNLDGDDVLTDTGYVSAAMHRALSDPDIVLVFGRARIGSTAGAVMNAAAPAMGPDSAMDGKAFLLRHPPYGAVCVPHLSALYRRDRALACGGYRANIHGADAELLYRLGLGGGKVSWIPNIAGYWRLHGTNASHAHARVFERHALPLIQSLSTAMAEAGGRAAARTLRRRMTAAAMLSCANQMRGKSRARIPLAMAALVASCPTSIMGIPSELRAKVGERKQRTETQPVVGLPRLTSIVVTFHGEGVLAHRTLLSVGRMRRHAAAAGLATEIITVLDKADPETTRIVREHPEMRIGGRVLVVGHGNLSLSRNSAIEAARGEIICILDGDDLHSEAWVTTSSLLANANDVAVHPELTVSFGDWHCVATHTSDTTGSDAARLWKNNDWTSCVTARRSLFQAVPYRPTGNGFGYEDWAWNCELVARGIAHVVAPSTALFYRRKVRSMVTLMGADKSIMPPTPFFDPSIARAW